LQFLHKSRATFFVLLISYNVGYTQHPGERKQLLDYDWKFFFGRYRYCQVKAFDDRSWRNLDLPHDWSIEGKLNPKNPTGGV
jgi:beta-galactosidase